MLVCICNMPVEALLILFSETRAGVRRLILNDLVPEVSPHSKEVLRQEVRILVPLRHVKYTSSADSNEYYFDPKAVTI